VNIADWFTENRLMLTHLSVKHSLEIKFTILDRLDHTLVAELYSMKYASDQCCYPGIGDFCLNPSAI